MKSKFFRKLAMTVLMVSGVLNSDLALTEEIVDEGTFGNGGHTITRVTNFPKLIDDSTNGLLKMFADYSQADIDAISPASDTCLNVTGEHLDQVNREELIGIVESGLDVNNRKPAEPIQNTQSIGVGGHPDMLSMRLNYENASSLPVIEILPGFFRYPRERVKDVQRELVHEALHHFKYCESVAFDFSTILIGEWRNIIRRKQKESVCTEAQSKYPGYECIYPRDSAGKFSDMQKKITAWMKKDNRSGLDVKMPLVKTYSNNTAEILFYVGLNLSKSFSKLTYEKINGAVVPLTFDKKINTDAGYHPRSDQNFRYSNFSKDRSWDSLTIEMSSRNSQVVHHGEYFIPYLSRFTLRHWTESAAKNWRSWRWKDRGEEMLNKLERDAIVDSEMLFLSSPILVKLL